MNAEIISIYQPPAIPRGITLASLAAANATAFENAHAAEGDLAQVWWDTAEGFINDMARIRARTPADFRAMLEVIERHRGADTVSEMLADGPDNPVVALTASFVSDSLLAPARA